MTGSAGFAGDRRAARPGACPQRGPRLIAAYCGWNDGLGEAVADFAVAYADRTEADHAEPAGAV